MEKKIGIISILFLAIITFRSVSAQPTIVYTNISQGHNATSMPAGAGLYIYGFVASGANWVGSWSAGQYASVSNRGLINVDANVLLNPPQTDAAVAITTSNADSIPTTTWAHVIAGAAVSGFSSYTATYATNNSIETSNPQVANNSVEALNATAATSVSDTFTVTSPGSLALIMGLGGDEQCINITGIQGMTVDKINTGNLSNPDTSASALDGAEIAYAYLNPGKYTATAHTQQCAMGQTPSYGADLISVVVFTSGTGSGLSTNTPMTSVPNTQTTTTINASGATSSTMPPVHEGSAYNKSETPPLNNPISALNPFTELNETIPLCSHLLGTLYQYHYFTTIKYPCISLDYN